MNTRSTRHNAVICHTRKASDCRRYLSFIRHFRYFVAAGINKYYQFQTSINYYNTFPCKLPYFFRLNKNTHREKATTQKLKSYFKLFKRVMALEGLPSRKMRIPSSKLSYLDWRIFTSSSAKLLKTYLSTGNAA